MIENFIYFGFGFFCVSVIFVVAGMLAKKYNWE